MPSPTRLLLLFLSLTLFACARMEIRSEHDRGVDFSRLKTYDWVPDPNLLSLHPLIRSAERDTRVKSLVERELSNKGFEKAAAGDPDFRLRYLVSIRRNMASETVRESDANIEDPEGIRWRKIGFVQTYSVDYRQGRLIIYVLQPDRKDPVWKGIAEAVLDESVSPEKRRERLAEAVRKIMARFPPK